MGSNNSLVPNIKKIEDSLLSPHSSIVDDETYRMARIQSALQLALTGLFAISDFLWLTFLDRAIPVGMSLVFLGIYLLGRTQHVTLSGGLTILSINILPFFLTITSEDMSQGALYGTLAWIAWAILLGSFLLSLKVTVVLAILNIAILFLLPALIPSITYVMLEFPLSFIFAMSVIILLGSFLRNKDLRKITSQQSQLEQQNEELALYTSLLCHDMRNDIGIILTATNVLMMESAGDDAKEEMQIIEAVAERILNLVSLLSYETTNESANLVLMIKDIAYRAKSVYPTAEVNVAANEAFLDVRFHGSRLLPLVFDNLIRNAAVYGGKHPKIAINVFRSGAELVIEIADNGPGLDPHVRNHLFEKGASTEGPEKGIGLYLSREVVSSCGGSLTYVEKPIGTAFQVRLGIEME